MDTNGRETQKETTVGGGGLGAAATEEVFLVSEDPLMVKVDHLKDNLYDKDHDVIKATSFEVISTLTDVLKTSSLWRDHVQTYSQHIGDFSFPSLADFGTAISGGNKVQCQAVLEEPNVRV
ncbi:hypothetical protein LWI28_001203 [Acer negundo]|uniref:Lon N-terminal domain-containing protein n=1 Tax=Acer negundo TaxID=4023 RepID=A0AAD5NW51_ACENE|nr:hypothetical protein LWI28_001203 [Acer negundo]